MFDDLKQKLLQNQPSFLQGGGFNASQLQGGGNALGLQGGQSPQLQQVQNQSRSAPVQAPPLPIQQGQQAGNFTLPGVNEASNATPTNPTGLGNLNSNVGTIRLGPANQDVNQNLHQQAQHVAMSNAQTSSGGGINFSPMQALKNFGNDAVQTAHNGIHAAGSIGHDLLNMSGLPAAVDAGSLAGNEISQHLLGTNSQKAIDTSTKALSSSLPQFLPVGIAEGIKQGGQYLVNAAFSPYVSHVANQQEQYAQKQLNNTTGNPVHNAAVNAYASGIKENILNNELAQQGWTPNTSLWTMGRSVVPAEAGLVAPFVGADEFSDPAAAFSAKVATMTGIGAAQGGLNAVAQPGKITPASITGGAMRGGIEGGILGAAFTAAPYIPDTLPDISRQFSEGIGQHLTSLAGDENGFISNPFAKKYNGLPENQVIMDPAKMDVLNEAKAQLTGLYSNDPSQSYSPSVGDQQQVINGLHQIKNENGLDFITGSPADRLQRITQYLEQNGSAIPKLQAGQSDRLLQPLNQIGAVGKDVSGIEPTSEELPQEPVIPEPAQTTAPVKVSSEGSTAPVAKEPSQLAEAKPTNGIKLNNEPAKSVKLSSPDEIANALGITEEAPALPRSARSGLALDRPDQPVDNTLALSRELGLNEDITHNFLGDEEYNLQKRKLNPQEKAQYHGTNPVQVSLPDVKPRDYVQMRTNPQIVENNLSNRLKNFITASSRLSPEEKLNFWRQVEGTDPITSKRAQTAVNDWREFDDHVNAYDHANGGQTPYWINHALHNWDLSNPEDQARYMEIARQRGMLDTDPTVFDGFHNMPRVFPTVAEGEAAGFHLSTNPIGDAIEYGQRAISRMKEVTLQHAIQDADMGADPNEKLDSLKISNGKSIAAHASTIHQARGYQRIDEPNLITKIYREGNRNLKATILSATLYHPVNINVLQAIPTIALRGHPVLAAQAIGRFAASAIPVFGREFTTNVFKGFQDHQFNLAGENVNVVDGAARMGTPLRQGSDFESSGNLKIAGNNNVFERWVFEQMIPVVHGTLVEAGMRDLARRDLSIDSPEAHALGSSINAIMGFRNSAVLNSSPHANRMLSDVFLANQFTVAKYAVLRKALTQWGAVKDNGLAGSYARRAVIGKYLTEYGAAMLSNALLTNNGKKQKDSWKDTLLRELTHPSIETPYIDSTTGNNVALGMPANFLSEPLSLATNLNRNPNGHYNLQLSSPSQDLSNLGFYGRNRLAVLPNLGLQVGTNTAFNGKPIYDLKANLGTKAIQIAANSANNVLPIPLQSIAQTPAVNKLISKGSPTAAGAIQMSHAGLNPYASAAGGFVGLTPKDDKSTGTGLASTQYYNQLQRYQNDLNNGNYTDISPNLAGMSKQDAAYWAAQLKSYQALSPGKDFAGIENSSQWNALNSQQKAAYLLMNNQKTGAQELSPIFYINQQTAQADPSRPHSPLYDLKGNDGVGFTLDGQGNIVGTQNEPRAQVAIDYQKNDDPTQKALMLTANPWLSNYENAVGTYSNNYKQSMTSYMQSEGLDGATIAKYWSAHPNQPAPIQSAVTPAQQSLMNQYEAISDPTAKSDFFDSNAKELSAAFTAAAVYSAQDATAKGDIPRQQYPSPTPEVANLLNQMQKNPNHDKAISKANALLIQNNPDLNQYLADIGIYDVAKNASNYMYQDPSHPGMSAAQLLNLQRPIDQTTMKDIVDAGKYDIGYNANAPAGQQYSFMGAGGNTGGFGSGFTSGSSSSKKQYRPFVSGPKYLKNRKVYSKKGPYIRKARAKVHVHGSYHATHGSVSIKKGSNPLKTVKIGR